MKNFFQLLIIFAAFSVFNLNLHAEEQVSLRAADGTGLKGLLFGEGETALVLCHGRGYKTGAESFRKEAQFFAEKGVLCLALSFRGYPSVNPTNLKGKEQDKKRAFYWEHEGNTAVRVGDWKLVSLHKMDWELYNLADDPYELSDLADRDPGKVEELRQKYQAWAKEHGVQKWPLK